MQRGGAACRSGADILVAPPPTLRPQKKGPGRREAGVNKNGKAGLSWGSIGALAPPAWPRPKPASSGRRQGQRAPDSTGTAPERLQLPARLPSGAHLPSWRWQGTWGVPGGSRATSDQSSASQPRPFGRRHWPVRQSFVDHRLGQHSFNDIMAYSCSHPPECRPTSSEVHNNNNQEMRTLHQLGQL